MIKSIANRFAFISIVFVVCTAATIGILQYWHKTTDQLERETQQLDFAVRNATQYLQDVIEDARRKVLFLSGTSAMRGLLRAHGNGGIDPVDGSSAHVWTERLAETFKSMATRYPELLQIRLIQTSGNHAKMVGAVRRRDQIFLKFEFDSQEKGLADDIKETLRSAPGSVVLGNIRLFRRESKIALPAKPALRAMTPVQSQSGQIFGVVIIDMDMAHALQRLERHFPDDKMFYLTNEKGDYLVHPDSSKAFGFDAGRPYRIQNDYSAFASFLTDSMQRKSSTTITDAHGEHFVHLAKLPFDPSNPKRHFVTAVVSPMSQLLAERRLTGNWIILISGILIGVCAILAVALARFFIRPLQKLKVAAQDLVAGASIRDIEVPRERSDEIGALARSIYTMAGSLEEKQASIRAILEAAVSPIITINDSGIIQDVNAATTDLFGYSREALVGSNVSLLMTARDRSRHDQYLKNYHRSNVAKVIGIGREVEAIRNDGTKVPVHLAVSEVRLKDRKLFAGIMTDLTELKKIDKLKNEFVSTVSHELRTPVTSIKGALGLLKSAVLGELPDQAKSMITIAYNNCDRLVRLINDILDIEKIKAGKLSFAFERISLGPFLVRTIEANKAYAEQLGVRLELGTVPDDLQVDTDPDRLAQIVTNLLSNAAKFSPKGEVVSVNAERIGGVVRVSVTDRGPGIPEEFRTQIFGQFAQADSSDTRAQGGTGLGLAITKAIVEVHGGSIDFVTADGKGTTFFFELPLVQTKTPFVPEAQGGGPAKVLICADEPNLATQLRFIFEDMGCDAEIYSSAAETKTSLGKEDCAALVLDLTLPGEDCAGLIRDIRQNPATRCLPVLAVSARIEAGQEALTGRAFRIADWLEKPVDKEQLRSSIVGSVETTGNTDAFRLLYVDGKDDSVAIDFSVFDCNAAVDIAKTCEEARCLLIIHDYDLVVFDLLLLDGEGEDLLPLILTNGTHTPEVLVISDKQMPESLAAKFEGALLKSQAPHEVLNVQIKTLLGSNGTECELDLTNRRFRSVA